MQDRETELTAGALVPLVTPPLPPTSASVNDDGELKDTPANRALHPTATPQEVFQNPDLLQGAYYSDEKSIVMHGDVKQCLRRLIDAGVMVDCIVTSPPYYGQRDYGVDGQIGLEDHPSRFIEDLVEVFDLCRKVLRDTGSLWINIGDTYWSGKGAHKSNEVKQGARRFGLRPQDKPGDGKWTRPKQLLLIPHRLAIALQDDEWLVRNDVVWVKPYPVPDQVRDRCSISHEYIFHLTKSRWYYFDQQSVGRRLQSGRVLPPLDTWIEDDSVWKVRPAPGNGKHKASFSEDLVRIPIFATTPPNGIVLDPFNGSGTSMIFARKSGFRSIGIDLNEAYCEETTRALKNVDAARTLDLEA